ncbi:MAG: hypothetical protein IJT44_09250 [Clostridia bacterium]|nr:hypothetical protein [Clostridia bacterium]
MRKKTWDLYAPIYKRAMQADQQIYDFIARMAPDVSGVRNGAGEKE